MELLEVWKNIPTFPNYEISQLGEIRNRFTGHILKPTYANGGNPRVVHLSYKGKIYHRCVDKIVRIVFGIPKKDRTNRGFKKIKPKEKDYTKFFKY